VLLVYLGFETIFKAFAGLPKPTVFQNIVGIIMSATLSLAVLWFIVFFIPDGGWFGKWAHIPVSILVIHYVFSMVLLILIRLCCRTKV
jgi:predicted small integral membrane protein